MVVGQRCIRVIVYGEWRGSLSLVRNTYATDSVIDTNADLAAHGREDRLKAKRLIFYLHLELGLDDRIADLPHIPFLGLSLFLSSCSDMYMCPLTAGSREHEMSWALPATAFGHPI